MNPILFNILLMLGIFGFAYLFGGIPTAVIVGKVFYKKNPLDYGSHNSGGTNAGRVLGKKAGVAVIVLDILKTATVFWSVFAFLSFSPLRNIAPYWDDGQMYLWGSLVFASLGHCFSPYLRGKGGKAVACFYGSTGGTSPILFPLCFLIFFLCFKRAKKVMSKASLLTGAILTALSWVLAIIALSLGEGFDSSLLSWTFGLGGTLRLGWESAVSVTLVYLILVYRHKDNLKRIHKGEEKPLHWEK